MPRFVWSTYFRAPLFAGLFALGYWASLHLPIISEWANESLVVQVLSEVAAGHYDDVSTRSLTVFQAGSFALDVNEVRAGIDFKPVLMSRARAPSLEDDAPAEDLDGTDATIPPEGTVNEVTRYLA
jgi:hypothetical protein